ncbi:collagen alpha-2(I) chain-like [Corvus kubaryi]|uniref:collagen alpha-2(I) chain-like n=1 Tax=Corvus kubaryi TaxID=68294 RepID=UPI001C05D750|nr:collagen alpha-2(I) chain-like [Corvus kubaryi]
MTFRKILSITIVTSEIVPPWQHYRKLTGLSLENAGTECRVPVRGISQRRAQTSTRAADERLPLLKLAHFSGQPPLLSGRPDSRGLPGDFPDRHCLGGPAGRVRHSTPPEHRGSTNIATQPPGTVSAARPALAGHSGGCRAECSCPQIPGECDPKVMVILGSHGHSENNIMSGPDMSSRNGKKHAVGKEPPAPFGSPQLWCRAQPRVSSSEGLTAAQPGRGATLGAAGQATNSCRRPARRGIATGAGGGTGSSGSCEKASGAAERGGGQRGGAEEEEEEEGAGAARPGCAAAARALPPGTAPLRAAVRHPKPPVCGR